MKRLLVAFALIVWPASALAGFADGLAAYDAGDYEAALAEWHALAEEGDAGAQAALAGLFRHGQGVPRDPARAARWYRRAALQGDAGAQLNLGEMYADGEGVGRDLVEAYVWLGLAALQGRVWALIRRDEVVREMSEAEQRQAQERLMKRRRGVD